MDDKIIDSRFRLKYLSSLLFIIRIAGMLLAFNSSHYLRKFLDEMAYKATFHSLSVRLFLFTLGLIR